MNRFIMMVGVLVPLFAFAQGIPIKGGSTTDLADVNATKQMRTTSAADGGVWSQSELMSGGPVGRGRGPNVMGAGLTRLATEEDELMFYDPVESTVVNSNLWGGAATTLTVTQTAANGIRFNAGSGTGTNTNVRLSSIQLLPYTMESSIVCRWRFRMSNTGQINQQVEVGMMAVTGTAAPTDGSFFRWNNAGNFVAVQTQASTEVSSATLTAPTANVFHTGMIVKHSNDTEFFIDDVLVATVTAATTDPNAWNTQRVPFSIRNLIAGSSPGAAPLYDQGATVCYGAIAAPRTYETQLATIGRGSWQSVTTTFAQTANWANSTSPTSASLSNTAAGYTTLGGRWQFAAVASAATDFALFAYTNSTGYQLIISSVRISSCNTGAAVTTTATILDWGVGVNASAVSLATADVLGPPATAWGTRRIALGNQGFIATAAIGVCAPDINFTFFPPLVVDSGRFFHVIVQVYLGSATASEVFRGDVTVSGYFE